MKNLYIKIVIIYNIKTLFVENIDGGVCDEATM